MIKLTPLSHSTLGIIQNCKNNNQGVTKYRKIKKQGQLCKIQIVFRKKKKKKKKGGNGGVGGVQGMVS